MKVFANADLSQHCPLTVEVEVLDEQFQPLPAGERSACRLTTVAVCGRRMRSSTCCMLRGTARLSAGLY